MSIRWWAEKYRKRETGDMPTVPSTKKKDVNASYMRVWKKHGNQKWQIILEVITL